MARLTSNILEGRAGTDYIPVMPLWVAIIRIFQVVCTVTTELFWTPLMAYSRS
jgi:hypothetical protein